MTRDAKTLFIKDLAAELGFDRVGIARANPVDRAGYYRAWLANGYAADMAYLAKNADIREDPQLLLAGAKSVICVALSYKRPYNANSTPSGYGKVAQYARGKDYHVVIRNLLEKLAAEMKKAFDEPFEVRPCVDTAPVLERAYAQQAGLGWIGKNAMLLSRELGSFTFLGELFTTLDLTPDSPATDHCGSCTRCLDACPTAAIIEPHVVDSRRCISYLTIEHRNEIAPELAQKMGHWVYGCDVCQDVCPYNAKSPNATHPEITEDRIPEQVELEPLAKITTGDYKRLTKGTAASRARREMWQRNAKIAANNQHGHGM